MNAVTSFTFLHYSTKIFEVNRFGKAVIKLERFCNPFVIFGKRNHVRSMDSLSNLIMV